MKIKKLILTILIIISSVFFILACKKEEKSTYTTDELENIAAELESILNHNMGDNASYDCYVSQKADSILVYMILPTPLASYKDEGTISDTQIKESIELLDTDTQWNLVKTACDESEFELKNVQFTILTSDSLTLYQCINGVKTYVYGDDLDSLSPDSELDKKLK